MTFGAVHKAVLYATVVVSLLPIATSGEIDLLYVFAAYGALIASWFYEVPTQRIEAHDRWWTIGTISALTVLGLFAWSSGNYLFYAILFALVMVVTRLFQSRGSRDTFQLYGLSFVVIVAGAVINPTLSFIFVFILYIVLLVWGLILLHLQRDLETLQAEKLESGERASDLGWKARNLVTPRFLVGSSVLALLIFASSLAIFFFFPRLGMGFFFSQGRSGQSVSGFADRIRLGDFGAIKDNLRVVLRVEIADDEQAGKRALRMRGISFDHYDGRLWTKTTQETAELPRSDPNTWTTRDDPTRLIQGLGKPLKQTIYLEPLQMDRRMVFGEPVIDTLSIDNAQLDRLRRNPTRFYRDRSGDISTKTPADVALRYSVTSMVKDLKQAKPKTNFATLSGYQRELYLQLPVGLEKRLQPLRDEMLDGVKSRGDPLADAIAIESYLRTRFRYSTEGGHDADRPLEDFLFNLKAGHCEYFATSMVVLLRTLGIPARPANGFYGGAYNAFGKYYQIRQADAHSWVEAFLPGRGWVTFDPSPPTEILIPGQDGILGAMDAWFDSLRLQWFKWVVEYDLEKQIQFFKAVGDSLGGVKELFPKPEGNPRQASSWRKGLKEWLNDQTTWLMLGTPIALLILWRFGVLRWFLQLLLGPRTKQPALPGAAGHLYRRMLAVLRRQGTGRLETETPRELALRLRAEGHPAAGEVDRLTAAFEAQRYALKEPTPESVAALERDLAALRRVPKPREDQQQGGSRY